MIGQRKTLSSGVEWALPSSTAGAVLAPKSLKVLACTNKGILLNTRREGTSRSSENASRNYYSIPQTRAKCSSENASRNYCTAYRRRERRVNIPLRSQSVLNVTARAAQRQQVRQRALSMTPRRSRGIGCVVTHTHTQVCGPPLRPEPPALAPTPSKTRSSAGMAKRCFGTSIGYLMRRARKRKFLEFRFRAPKVLTRRRGDGCAHLPQMQKAKTVQVAHRVLPCHSNPASEARNHSCRLSSTLK